MKKNYLYLPLLLTCGFGKILCEEAHLFEPSSYSRSYLMNLTERKRCDTDDDCPQFSVCEGKSPFQFCKFEKFLCVGNENDNCQHINSALWDEKDEAVIYKNIFNSIFRFKFGIRPIMKTCTKEQVDKGECKTKECSINEDCMSGLCYSNNCITEQPIYVCAGTNKYERYLFNCKKLNNMECHTSSECYSDYCDNGYCKKAKLFMLYYHSFKDNAVPVLFVIMCLPFVLYFFLKIEEKYNKYENLKSNEEDKKKLIDKESEKEIKDKKNKNDKKIKNN
ncbi:hypothetical protein H8356DRAFT_1055741 [Neocallimastix lanati (nom. inval.)]|jgi:hypothetical protein|nr:hypothetical protein H8356DRAFT_1055741 [Neocallimastix sp. JGI-2020a]